MFFGLTKVSEIPARNLKTEFQTLIDPYVQESFKSAIPPGFMKDFEGWSKSYYSKDEHIKSLMKYNKLIRSEPSDEHWSHTKREAYQYFDALPKVQSLSASSDFDLVRFHQSTSAGYGYFAKDTVNPTHKGPINGENHRRAKSIASKIVHVCTTHQAAGTFKEFLTRIPFDSTPDVAFTRTQLVELPDTKVRNVFGECFHYVLLEGLFAQPLIEKFMQLDTFYYIGKDPVIGVPKLINNLLPNDAFYATFDWSAFDASVQPYEIELAFDLLERMLVFPDNISKLMFSYVRVLFLHRKIASPDGNVYLRYGGVPSGSFFTHIIDTIVNWNRIRYLFHRHRLIYGTIKFHGDDSFVEILNFHDCFREMIDDAAELGWFINIFKSSLVQDKSKIEFLGRTVKFGTNYRDEIRCLRLMLYPEYPVTDPQISIARMKAIDQDSGYRAAYVPNALQYLIAKYGDSKLPLPRQFRTFRIENSILPQI